MVARLEATEVEIILHTPTLMGATMQLAKASAKTKTTGNRSSGFPKV